MDNVVVLLISIVGVLIDRSDAVLCDGTCTSQTPYGLVACDKSHKVFKWREHDSPPNCSGVACEWLKVSTRSESVYYIYRKCVTNIDSSIVNRCRQNGSDEGYFINNKRCCKRPDPNTDNKYDQFKATSCHCDSDYCNVGSSLIAADKAVSWKTVSWIIPILAAIL